MCAVLKIPRSTYYYESKESGKTENNEYTDDVIRILKASRRSYGTRRIRREFLTEGKPVSRCRIKRIMAENGLVSSCTVAKYKTHKSTPNEYKVSNVVDTKFDDRDLLEGVVSDLTYVRVNGKWHYVCFILDLDNREIIGYSAGPHKDAQLVYKAFATIKYDLCRISIFHTDRGNEFKNNVIDGILGTFKIGRSLSKKGCPYDNVVAEDTFKTFKVEFAYQHAFENIDELQLELFDYVNWYNNVRLHSSLGYLSPITYRKLHLKKVV